MVRGLSDVGKIPAVNKATLAISSWKTEESLAVPARIRTYPSQYASSFHTCNFRL